MINTTPTGVRSAGFTLIEIMVALIVMSIGLLGVAGLQAVSSQYKLNSWARSSISSLTSDIAERIRVNSDAAGTNALQGGVTSPSSYRLNASDSGFTWTAQQSASLTVGTDCETSACSSTDRATYDMLVWRQKVRDALPQGAVWLSGDRGAGFEVTLMWMDKGFVDKQGSTVKADDDRALKTSPNCSGSELPGMAEQSCCPTAAAVAAGVRCVRYSFLP